ncbi:PREDICTED: lachesin-like isoform X3 [Polistes dominula]|uniref:Lachesin-like isoform X3 n=1 Tax=Polistes dominula TaxID=743375 RepID=A0ABM1IW17_POLDO|nr:PREDICTED: lachesin-like isoform X3 [Polistes dominula]
MRVEKSKKVQKLGKRSREEVVSANLNNSATNTNLALARFLLYRVYEPSARKSLSEPPMFAEPIPNVTVALGRDVSLPCVVKNLGTYKVAWLHVGRQMLLTVHKHMVVKIPRFTVSHENQNTWLLHISGVQQDDRGYYMCQVNTNPMISQVGFLQVVVPPNILDSLSTESTVAVRENQNITLTCKADGYPTPKLSWKREDGQGISINRHKKVNKYEGEQLNLTRITRNEMGAYLCIASNGVPPTVSKRITVDVEFSPMIFVPNQLVGAPAGTNVTIDCHTEAFPRAMSYWFQGNEMILSNEKYTTSIMENSYRAHMKLHIKNLQAGDFGNYRCISKNSLGETEGSIRLYEIPKPSAPPKATEIKSSANKEGSAYIIRWSAPQLMIVAVQYILTGPYMPPYVPQTAN